MGNGKSEVSNTLFPYVDEIFSLGTALIVYSLCEGGVINDYSRATYPLPPTMDGLTERTPGEDPLYGSDEEEDNPFNYIVTCFLDDEEDSIYESDDE